VGGAANGYFQGCPAGAAGLHSSSLERNQSWCALLSHLRGRRSLVVAST
jgi:hypothetical protein